MGLFKNSRPSAEKLKWNSKPSSDELQTTPRSCESSSESTKRPTTPTMRTRRTSSDCPTASTSSTPRSNLTRRPPRTQPSPLLPPCLDSERSSTSLMKPTSELKWPKLLSPRPDPRLLMPSKSDKNSQKKFKLYFHFIN